MPAEDKTEKPTDKRKQDERKKGNVFQSKEIMTVLQIFISFTIIKMIIWPFYERMRTAFNDIFIQAETINEITSPDIIKMGWKIFNIVVVTILPLGLIIMLISVLAIGVQTRFIFSREKLKFKISNISPFRGIKKMFSMGAIVEILKSIAKIVILGIVAYTQIIDFMGILNNVYGMEIMESVAYTFDRIMNMVYVLGMTYIIICIADFSYQRYSHNKGMMMTKQEVKEEYKQTEGDPKIKAKIREKQRALGMNRMMKNVLEADVVVRNPTHFAVALRYDTKKDKAPVILAKGQDFIALKIIEQAEKNDIIVVENKPLARGLYEAGKIDKEIPGEFFHAVAEILAWIYNTKKNSQK